MKCAIYAQFLDRNGINWDKGERNWQFINWDSIQLIFMAILDFVADLTCSMSTFSLNHVDKMPLVWIAVIIFSNLRLFYIFIFIVSAKCFTGIFKSNSSPSKEKML